MKDIFLTYANASLRNNPKNLSMIFEVIDQHLSFNYSSIFPGAPEILSPIVGGSPITSINPSILVGEVIYYIIYFANHPDMRWAEGAFESLSKSTSITLPRRGTLEIAFEAAYAFRDGYCMEEEEEFPEWYHSSCLTIPERKELIQRDDLFWIQEEHPNRIKCYECDQLYFRNVLKLVVDGNAFKEIPGFGAFMNRGILLPVDGIFRPGPDPEFPYRHVFNEFLRGIIAYSLNSFLDNNDRRLLRLCKTCNVFYLNKTIRKSYFCSDRCRINWHNEYRIKTGKSREYKREQRREGKQQ